MTRGVSSRLNRIPKGGETNCKVIKHIQNIGEMFLNSPRRGVRYLVIGLSDK
jgi:hypothetical protein